jgi:hypothetical protein
VGKPLKKINFFWFGDSLCNPKTLAHLRFARARLPKVKFYVSTNAGLLSPAISDALLEGRLLDVINFDVDGATKATYESIRRGVDFDKVTRNITYFIDKKRRLGLSRPQVRLTIIRMQENAHEIAAFRKQWKGLADKVYVNVFSTWMGSIADRNVGRKLEESRTGSFAYPCRHLWDELVIASDGTAGLCCLDYNLTVPVGNAAEQTVEDIWRGEKMRGYRARLLRMDYAGIPCCANCNNFLYQDRSLWARLWR